MASRALPAIAFLAALAASGAAAAEEGAPAPTTEPTAAPYRTPRAGEAATFLLGERLVEVPGRDRASQRALNLGLSYYVPGIDHGDLIPFGALYFRELPEGGRHRLRAILAGVHNEIDAGAGFGDGGWQLALTFENHTIPAPSAEIIEGHRLDGTSIRWGYLRGGSGLAWRLPIAPGAVENELRLELLGESGYLYFHHTHETAPNYLIPPDTMEYRLHFRLRLDALERNLLELRHAGWAGGLDAVLGHREEWRDHSYDGQVTADDTRTYFAIKGFLTLAGGLPALSERHRLCGAIHFGYARRYGLDRFSALRIGGGPSGDEAEALSRLPVPGALFDEFLTDHHAYGTIEYRYEIYPFLYLHLAGTAGYMRRFHINANRELSRVGDFLGVVSAMVTTGFLWESLLVVEYAYNWGVIRTEGRGDHNILASWSKSF
jgi:hypothetical protein